MLEITDEPTPIQSRQMHWGCNLVYLHHVFGKEILSEEALATIAAGVEFVNNQWPLVPVFIDSLGLNAVSTNDLLFQKSRCLLPSMQCRLRKSKKLSSKLEKNPSTYERVSAPLHLKLSSDSTTQQCRLTPRRSLSLQSRMHRKDFYFYDHHIQNLCFHELFTE